MRTTYILEDLFNNMVELEDACHNMYARLSRMASDDETVQLFEELATKESKNRKIFDDYLRNLDHPIILDDEYISYLRVLLHNNFKMFRFSEPPPDADATLRTVIRMEKDLYLLLMEMRKILGSSIPEAFDKIICDKRIHLKLLFEHFERLSLAK
jgi:rubrerythrin